MTNPIPEGWTAHDGRFMPVASKARVNVLYRDGHQGRNHEARLLTWYDHGDRADIIAYQEVK